MSLRGDAALSRLYFYATSPYPCSYLSGQMARSQVATPSHVITTPLYGQLVGAGFRRSGLFTYRPLCDHCQACIPVRIDVGAFRPDRSQRRAERRNAGLVTIQRPLAFEEEHYALYRRYQDRRHRGGGMDGDNEDQYAQFLLQSPVDTALVEFREDGILRMVSVIDLLPDGLSSVYTFFDPDIPAASLGTASILWQISLCRRHGLPYLYLGYWIRESQKMAYKSRFHSLQALVQGQWRTLSQAELAGKPAP